MFAFLFEVTPLHFLFSVVFNLFHVKQVPKVRGGLSGSES